jgi:hypothetical protein
MEKLVNAARSRAFSDRDGKSLYLCVCPSLAALPEAVTPTSPHFGLLIALDARGVRDDEIWRSAESLVSKGLAYLCVWGPDCERVHDRFDEAINEMQLDGVGVSEDDVIMTTWHSDEPLSEALWYFVNCAFPTHAYERKCKEWIIAPIASSEWEQVLRSEIHNAYKP